MKIRQVLNIPVVLSLMAALSCTRTPEIVGPVEPHRPEAEVTLALQMPALYSSEEATVDENLVKTAYILSFRADDNVAEGDELFDYSSLAYSVTDGNLSRYKNVKVSLLKKDYPQKLVLITNAKLAVEELALVSGALTKKEVLELLEFGRAEQWHSSMSSFVPIPMWGESERVTIDDDTKSIGTVTLTRMVSRIDVVKEAGIGDDLFELTSVHLYNRFTNGRVAPHRASTHWDETQWKAIHPSLTSSPQKVKEAIKTDAYNSGTTSLIPTLYAFEAECPESGSAAEATCVVIGGKYKGADKPSYYRVDFVEKEDDVVKGYKHLLRNHIYRINITDVYGQGHPDPDEAFESQSVNIDADVKEWDEGSITDVVFDKDYMLGVSQTEYYLARNASVDNLLYVTTDVPAGGTITCDADWLTLNQTTFPANTKYEVYFDLEENTTGSPRTAKITVRAGRLSIVVMVVQGIHEKYSLHVEDENEDHIQSLLFTSYGDQLTFSPRNIKAVWSPTGENCMVSYYDLQPGGLGFTANPFADPIIYGGQQGYTVSPNAITSAEKQTAPFVEKNSRVNYVVGEGTDAMVWPLSLRQVHYQLIAEPEESYPLDGSSQYFILSTNADWTVSATAGNNDLASIQKNSGGPCPDGERFYFTMADDPDGNITDLTMTLTFTYTGEDGRSATHTVIINGAPARKTKDAIEANSYLLEPGGDGVSIPLAWANGSEQGQLIGPNDDVKLKVLWLDTDRGIADNSVISSYLLKGNGSSGFIEVYPGSQEGNALIAAIIDNEIKWSWHIWVTNYNIEGTAFPTASNTYMRINLGAISDSPGSVDSYGLMYQFGRKDPFPHRKSAAVAGNVQQDLWDEDGAVFKIDFLDVTQTNNIFKSLSTPTTFYRGYQGQDYDWVTNNSQNPKRTDLWYGLSGEKTHYDPCPGGWRTATPASGITRAYTDLGTGGTGNSTAPGWTFSGTSSYWQFSGVITPQGAYQMGRYGNSSLEGFYWGGTTNGSGQYAYTLYMTTTWPQNDAEIQRSHGMNVRCVKE